MLRIERINAGYGNAQVLRDLSFDVVPGEVLCLLGRNGAGKTTTLKAIMGLLPLMSGQIGLGEQVLSELAPHKVPLSGIGYIPQGRRLFSELTVAQTLEIGLMARGTGAGVRDDVLSLFPRLRERLDQTAQTLSGGEQQMLATARALCLKPDYLLMDEPTEGLQPSMIDAIRDVITVMRDRGVGILLVEQRVEAILSISDRVAFIENGALLELMDANAKRADPSIIARQLGV